MFYFFKYVLHNNNKLIRIFICKGINRKTLDIILSPFHNNTTIKNSYNELLMDRLVHIITLSCQTSKLCFIIHKYSIWHCIAFSFCFLSKEDQNFSFYTHRHQSEACYIRINH